MLASGCSKRNPGDSQGKGNIVPLYADLVVLQERSTLRRDDSTLVRRGKDSLFAHYAISEKELQMELENYKNNLTSWRTFNENVVHRLEELQRSSAEPKDSASSIKGIKK